ncbi:MAG: hypothetical protein ACREUD_08655, partial [Gammaproteobacteria bacterium]
MAMPAPLFFVEDDRTGLPGRAKPRSDSARSRARTRQWNGHVSIRGRVQHYAQGGNQKFPHRGDGPARLLEVADDRLRDIQNARIRGLGQLDHVGGEAGPASSAGTSASFLWSGPV